MRYGYFDDKARGYGIDRMDVPASMTNYLGTQRMGAVISHNAGGSKFSCRHEEIDAVQTLFIPREDGAVLRKPHCEEESYQLFAGNFEPDGFDGERRWRGAEYRIEVKNPRHAEKGVASIEVDGCGAKRIPAFDGGVHRVRVTMG